MQGQNGQTGIYRPRGQKILDRINMTDKITWDKEDSVEYRYIGL
jgi:hypothetical protein